MEYALLTAHWRSYALLDFGEGWRYEKWGSYTVARPDSWAVGIPQSPRSQWTPDSTYHPTGSYQGQWLPPLPDKWVLPYEGQGWRMQLWARRGKFKHLGIFPEQAPHWEWLYAWLRKQSGARVLNLFAYTGAASIAAALAGAQVTHVDASKSALSWAAENAQLNQISTIRWIAEDARQFVQREIRRGHKYAGILLDPPAYGIGTEGKKWEIQKDLPPLLRDLRHLISPERGLFLLNIYSADFSPYTIARTVQEALGLPLLPEVGELVLSAPEGRLLSTGIFARLTW